MPGRNPKGAALGASHYESSEIYECFQDLIKPLIVDLKNREVAFTPRDLSVFVGQLQQFQQECLGAFNRPATAPIRIPAKFFKVKPHEQVTIDTALYTIIRSAYQFRLNHSWKKWDLANPAKKQRNADLITAIRTQLIKKGFITVPKIAIMETVSDATRRTIIPLIRKIGAIYVEDKGEATHILYGKLHEYNVEGVEEDWFRTLEKDGLLVLVHWWYYPDSFDSWLPQTQQFADPEEAPEHTGSWRISIRWVQDSERFNELMNEEDYEDIDDEEDEEEDDDDEEEEEHVQATLKRKLSEVNKDQPTVAAPAFPVVHKEYQPVVRIRDIELEKPQVGSRQRKNEFEPYLNGDIMNISQYTAANVEYPKRPTKIQKLDNSGEKAVNIPSLIKPTPYDYEEISLPSWFDSESIHDIEKIALPEFFKGDNTDLTPETYTRYRNHMIDSYKSNPDYYLTISACKSKLDVDLVTLVRMHSFLEAQHLINVQPDPRRRIFDPYIDSDPAAHIKPKSQRNFKDIDSADIEYLRNLIYSESNVTHIRSSWDLSIEDPLNPNGRKHFFCCNCHVECSEVRYQSLKAKDFQVCIDCYLEGRFPATFFGGDFLRVEGGPDIDIEEEWTDDEVLRLLEGVDRLDDDWLMISEHVGSRSKEQCITKFLQLPINDEFLTAKLTDKELEDLPFGDLPNPVMTTIAFLSGHINPGVGAAAAKTALKDLMQSGQGRNDEVKHEIVQIEGDSMEVVEEPTFSKNLMKSATISALKSAVENARKLASYEDQEIQHWTRLAVKTMVDKLSFKVQQYEELETSLETEIVELEKQQALLKASIEAISTQHYPLNGTGEINTASTSTI